MEVTKVKHRDGKTTVLGETPNGNHKDKIGLRSCPDMPRPAFKEALAAVSADVVKAIGIKGNMFQAAFSVYEVAVEKEETSGRRAFVFGAMLMTPWGPMKAPLPRMIERTDNETDTNVLSDVAVKRIDKLFKAAKAYHGGDRVAEQTEAFEEKAAAGGK